MLRSLFLSLVFWLPVLPAHASEPENTEVWCPPDSDRVIHAATLSLPGTGRWTVVNDDARTQLYLSPAKKGAKRMAGQRQGRRVMAMKAKRRARAGSHVLRGVFSAARTYALAHGDIGPANIEVLADSGKDFDASRFIDGPWGKEAGDGPFGFLIPDVRFRFDAKRRRVAREDRELLALELQPYIDDGMHWVLYNDGRIERVAIDPMLVQRYGLVIRPVTTHAIEESMVAAPEPKPITYRLMAHSPTSTSTQTMAESLLVPLRNTLTGETLDVPWRLSGACPGKPSLARDFQEMRRLSWLPLYRLSRSPVLATWMGRGTASRASRRGRRRDGHEASAFAIMGGRAAVRETLQMQLLVTGTDDQPHTLPLTSLTGVEVKSHPFEEMLDGRTGGRLALADLVPADQLFLYLAKPETLLGMLDGGAAFLSRIGGAIAGTGIKYGLKARYLRRLGLDEGWIRQFLDSGAVAECAIIAPDMFFIDGTDITVISRLSQPGPIRALLALIGVTGLADGPVVERKASNGRSTFWASRGDLLVVSSSRDALDAVLALRDGGGEGSLGRSAEFRYMLTQLPLREQTRAYAYLSDPFIRKLVGPETKIGQLRRMNARAEMERITAAALLATLDGLAPPLSLASLVEQDYLPNRLMERGYSVDAGLRVHSEVYGTLADMSPLSAVPVELISKQEAQGYRSYVQRYNRFWRRFFDPIAVRLDDPADGGPEARQEATVFILPLIDNTIYNALKEVIVSMEEGGSLQVPVLSPDPVLMLSLNLKEDAWEDVIEVLSDFLVRYARIAPAFLDDLGPGLHLAVHDADPVIALGSGDLLGLFGGNMGRLGSGSTSLMITAALAILTRPVTLAVETRDPEATRRYLRRASASGLLGRRRFGGDFSAQFFQVAGQDSWVYSIDIMGMVKLRYGLEVRDGFLMIRNIPWSARDRVQRVDTVALNGASLVAWPGASRLQLPGLHAAAVEQQSDTALSGAGLLYPLLVSGYADMADVLSAHKRLFGFTPVHPPGGTWAWERGQVVSSDFGSVYGRRFPPYRDGDTNFGLMKAIAEIGVQMQFEDSGLRTRLRWRMR